MASAQRLMGVGVNSEVANRTGFFVQTVESGDSVDGPGNKLVRCSGSVMSFGSNFDEGDVVRVMFVTAGSLQPASTDLFNLKATASAMTMTAGVTKDFTKFDATRWLVTDATA